MTILRTPSHTSGVIPAVAVRGFVATFNTTPTLGGNFVAPSTISRQAQEAFAKFSRAASTSPLPEPTDIEARKTVQAAVEKKRAEANATYEGMWHIFQVFNHDLPESNLVRKKVSTFLSQHFGNWLATTRRNNWTWYQSAGHQTKKGRAMQSRNWPGGGAVKHSQRRRRAFPGFVVMALLMQIVTIQVEAADTRVRPNIVVVLVDDLRWDDIGCAGHPFVRTPQIDRIAREGVRFRNAFCTTPLCSPVRACLLTGLHTHHHGILDNINRSEQSHRLKTFPQELQRSGYTTAYVGKWHMGNDDTARPGFDRWVGIKGQGTSFDPVLNVDGERVKFTGHTTDVLNRQAVDFIRGKHSKPFCLYVAHKALHPELTQRDDGSITDPKAARFLPARRHAELYADVAIPRRLNVTDTLQGKPALLRKIEALPALSRATGTSDETVRDRLRMLAGVDDGVGLLLDALKANGKLDETVFVFTSDHGYWYGEHGLSVERRLAYEEALRIPLLIRFPPLIRPGSIVDEFALSIDLAPTLLELAGTTSRQRMDGHSLVPLLKGPAADWRSSFLVQYNTDTVFPRVRAMGYRAIRTKRWKFIRYLELDGMDELYDLQTDPYEMTNVVGLEDSREVVKRLNQELNALLDDAG